ncbi:hypothetical protein Lepto782_23445 (plasmid) [Leptospira interrogans serovar Canicola]|uniref:Uncharacterized protein n=1 Tax=Leptospira interrogans serovar Canicola TaxID=211880 RepID=A0AAP9WFS1_LEPIR|nr:hypothetical protein [Leptospira interrogans]MBE0302178.1 hypothetical protein [Leptospira interrogans serovar Yeoncheon]QOI45135.1 hypothetical protein Lepto782_23445 [Leptospira interrogans serovar Canicola]
MNITIKTLETIVWLIITPILVLVVAGKQYKLQFKKIWNVSSGISKQAKRPSRSKPKRKNPNLLDRFLKLFNFRDKKKNAAPKKKTTPRPKKKATTTHKPTPKKKVAKKKQAPRPKKVNANPVKDNEETVEQFTGDFFGE